MEKDSDKWLDDILGSSEKQDICIKVKQAIDNIEGMRVVDALNVLYDLFSELGDEEFDKERAKSKFEDSLRESIDQAMYMHSHSGNRIAGMTGTSTYTVSPEFQRLYDEIRDVKRDIRDLYHVFRSTLEGVRINLPVSNPPVSGTVAMTPESAWRPQPIRLTEEQRLALRLSEEERRSLMGL